MGAPRARAEPDLGRIRQDRSAAAALDFAVAQILRDDMALGALPAVLARLVTMSGVRAAVAFQPSGDPSARVLAMHPPGAVEPGLLARIGALTLTQRDAAPAAPVQVTVEAGEPATSALLAYSAPVDGQCLCALALIGDAAGWDDEIRATAHGVAAVVATQIRHANSMTELAEIERSHAALADQTERLNQLIATALPGILISDECGQITHINRSFTTIFGLGEPQQLVGTPVSVIVGRMEAQFDAPGEFARRSAGVLRSRRPVSGMEFKAADGRSISHDYLPVLVDGRFRGDLWLAWDVSDRAALEKRHRQMLEAERSNAALAERAHRQLAEQNERLRKLDEARNQFLAIVSHELRTPLTSIVSFSELIRGEAEGLTPEGVKFLDIIERNADRLHRLVGDLLMLDRLDAGALPLDLAPVSIPDLVAEAARSASAGAAKQAIAIEVTAGAGPGVPGDHRRLMQVLDNLIANAVKFSHRNSLVRVTAAYDGGQWRIDVADNGIGIPSEEAGQLFHRFVRASNARTAGLPGTGLGLSIVKVLVEMHGGHVEVDSALGHGSTFSVYLPAAGGQA